MKTVTDIVSVLVIICMLGAMANATKALRARKGKKDEEKKESLKLAGLFVLGYVVLNVLRLYLMSKL